MIPALEEPLPGDVRAIAERLRALDAHADRPTAMALAAAAEVLGTLVLHVRRMPQPQLLDLSSLIQCELKRRRDSKRVAVSTEH